MPNSTTDITNHEKRGLLQRALDECLIYGYDDDTLRPESNLTRSSMLLIAERAGYIVDTRLGNESVVTRSELYRFLDYLQATRQIGLIPTIQFNPIITRVKYLLLLQEL